jgi:acetylornithine deacetylase/succinyl-diaminopimelate desuccinylase-like protein
VTGNEEAIARYVEEELRGLGPCPRVEANNVYVEKGGGPGSLLLNSHLDTVELGSGWTRDPFGAVLENGRVYGRGASDDKGNIAAMLEIARLRKGGAPAPHLHNGKEFGVLEERELLSQHLRADKALVLEPQFGEEAANILHGCRGIRKSRSRSRKGPTRHPNGVNAVTRAARSSRSGAAGNHKVS